MNTSPWNKDRIIGQKRPLQISDIWGIRIRLELEGKVRDLALFNMALDSKLRGCDLVKLKVSDVAYGSSVSSRATVLQQKTGSPVQFEITKGTREAVAALRLSGLQQQPCANSGRWQQYIAPVFMYTSEEYYLFS